MGCFSKLNPRVLLRDGTINKNVSLRLSTGKSLRPIFSEGSIGPSLALAGGEGGASRRSLNILCLDVGKCLYSSGFLTSGFMSRNFKHCDGSSQKAALKIASPKALQVRPRSPPSPAGSRGAITAFLCVTAAPRGRSPTLC